MLAGPRTCVSGNDRGGFTIDPTNTEKVARNPGKWALTIDPRLPAGGGVSDVRITTDHPDQREVTISIHVSPSE